MNFEDPISKSVQECQTCGKNHLESIVQCAQKNCQKWFCNNKDFRTFQSHILHHLTEENHLSLAFHRTHPLHKIPIECYECGNKSLHELALRANRENTFNRVAQSFICINCFKKLPISITETYTLNQIVQNGQFISSILKSFHIYDDCSNFQISIFKSSNQLSPNDGKKFKNTNEYAEFFMEMIERESRIEQKTSEQQFLKNIRIYWNKTKNDSILQGQIQLPNYQHFELPIRSRINFTNEL